MVAPTNDREYYITIQNAIRIIDVNSYNIRYYDSCYDDSNGSDNNENQLENSKKNVVVVLQERLLKNGSM